MITLIQEHQMRLRYKMFNMASELVSDEGRRTQGCDATNLS